jgi:pimeloyl-ACP methyl ester carboxylesterase
VRAQLQAKGLAVPKAGTVAGNLVLLHGRGGRKEDFLLIAERLCAVGFRCLIPDLPGHGDNPEGMVQFGAGEAELPARVLKESAATFGFEPEPAGLLGMSMGGSVAVHAAALDTQPWKALVIISSFDRLEPVVRAQGSSRGGAWLGGLWVSGADFIYEQRTGRSLASVAPVNLAANLTMPTLVLHGTKDRVIPMEAGKRLYDALPPPLEKAWIEVPGADHDNVLVTDFPVYATVAEWMLRHVTPALP